MPPTVQASRGPWRRAPSHPFGEAFVVNRRHVPLAVLVLLPAFAWGPAVAAPVPTDPGVARALAAPAVHTELRESRPAADAEVDEPVRELLLVYTTRVELPLSQVTVSGPDGMPVPAGELHHPEGAGDRLRLAFDRPLGPGVHSVQWRVGAPDGHIVSGSFRFTVVGPREPDPEVDPDVDPEPPVVPDEDPTAVPPPPAVPAEAMPLLPPGTGTRWLHLLGTILVLGVVGFRIGVAEPLRKRGEMVPTLDEARRHFRRLAWLGAVLLLVTAPLRLLMQMEALGAGLMSEPVRFLLFHTGWGAGWFLHRAAALIAVIGLVVVRGTEDRDRGWGIVAGAALLLPLVPALSGHAWGADARVFAVPSLYVHVAAAGVWLGGLITLLAAGLPAVRTAVDRAVPAEGSVLPPLARLVNGFSRMAVVAVGILVFAGVLNAVIHLESLSAIAQTAYGRTLLLKVGLAAFALLLGFYNWRRVRPGLATRPDPGALRIPATVEATLGILVLLVTAVLVATPLPR